ncbi:MAG: inorganic pyrophosphatase [Amphiamblys sp. WSBS2006]|nr:MAG: inorganic pyrophosphatase [Amphiamblys sp. WSBS2006]
MTSYRAKSRHEKNTSSYELYLTADEKVISPFHDIQTFNDDGSANMVVEIPRWTNKKLEIDTKTRFNPIKHDIKKNEVRTVASCFPYHGYIWNYGALPQTWESPHRVDTETGLKGDNDPLDAIEIGTRVLQTGSVVKVKILGALALIDEGELDWKIICIDTQDPMAGKINTVEDIRKEMPGLLEHTVRWFKIYKVPDGKPLNTFAFDDSPIDRDQAVAVVKKCSEMWCDLVRGKEKSSIAIQNTTMENTPGYIVEVLLPDIAETEEHHEREKAVFVSEA